MSDFEDETPQEEYRLPIGQGLSEQLLANKYKDDPLKPGKGPLPLGARLGNARRHYLNLCKEANSWFHENQMMNIWASVLAERYNLSLEATPVLRMTEDGLVFLENIENRPVPPRVELEKMAERLNVDISMMGPHTHVILRYLQGIEKDMLERGLDIPDEEPDETTVTQLEVPKIRKKG